MKNKFKYIISLVSLIIVCFPSITYAITKVSCGNAASNYLENLPAKIPELSSFGYTVLEVAVPIIIILFGMIDLIKAITAGKEDEMKKAQGIIIRRIITGAIIFFIFAIVKLLIGAINENSSGIVDCMDCFINNKCSTQKIS